MGLIINATSISTMPLPEHQYIGTYESDDPRRRGSREVIPVKPKTIAYVVGEQLAKLANKFFDSASKTFDLVSKTFESFSSKSRQVEKEERQRIESYVDVLSSDPHRNHKRIIRRLRHEKKNPYARVALSFVDQMMGQHKNETKVILKSCLTEVGNQNVKRLTRLLSSPSKTNKGGVMPPESMMKRLGVKNKEEYIRFNNRCKNMRRSKKTAIDLLKLLKNPNPEIIVQALHNLKSVNKYVAFILKHEEDLKNNRPVVSDLIKRCIKVLPEPRF